MPDKKSVLFVDDEPNILSGLRRMLRPMRREWNMHFADSGWEALRIMAEKPIDVIVSDMRMPGMDGVELLQEVRRRYPNTVCLALSGEASKESVLQSVGPIHQYLPKPCDADEIRSALSRFGSLHDLLAVEKLRILLTELETLPSLPQLYKDLMRQLESPDGSLKAVGRIVSRDIAMSAKVLQLVNSAFFGMPKHVFDPAEAVNALGMETIKALTLTVCVFAQFEDRAIEQLALKPLWDHSMTVAGFAKEICLAEAAEQEVRDHAFVAGLLHDVGKLVFASMLPEEYAGVLEQARSGDGSLWKIERERIGASHAEVGSYLLGLWGFPDAVMEALAFHHRPQASHRRAFCPLTAVHVANALARQRFPGQADAPPLEIDHSYLDALRVSNRFSVWVEACRASVTEEVV